MAASNIDEISDDVLLTVLSFVGLGDLLNASAVCRRWLELARHNSLWKAAAVHLCLVDQSSSSSSSSGVDGDHYFQLVSAWAKRWPLRYFDTYGRARQLWQRVAGRYGIEEKLAAALDLSTTSDEVAAYRREADSALHQLEASVLAGRRLPDEIATFLRVLSPVHCPGLFGARTFYNVAHLLCLYDPDNLATAARSLWQLRADSRLGGMVAPLLGDDGLYLRYVPVASCLLSGLEKVLVDVDSGELFVPTRERRPLLVRVGRSFYSYVEWLLGLPAHPERGVPTLWPAENRSTCVTRGIRVDAVFSFVASETASRASGPQPPSYLWAYTIELSMAAEAPDADSCQLESRHWIVEDADGAVSEVDGRGVVGMYPVCRPGMPTFAYQSCTTLPTPSGSMRGTFTMKNLLSQQTFAVDVPAMLLRLPVPP